MGRLGVFSLRGRLKSDLQTRLLRWMSGPEGLIDLCFRGADLTAIDGSSPLGGIPLTDPVKFKRHRPDGVVVEWVLRGSKDPRQPFYIQDLTPIEYRIPTGAARIHQNGAQGISSVHTSDEIEVSVSNAMLEYDENLPAGSLNLVISSELNDTDRTDGDAFYNANIKLVSEASMPNGVY